ncbi:sulfite exporter TauE/SafE family protein [Acinetobacter larvae]|uniref:Probable membrane transporter protein n=1 Tax=Acinetobacter larvae TaxID=1789224 RepID=A0A1B2M174_9GAMM|nr:sulfite exporter TauE/SafE family protein [Acinetobacter larvae]AOA58952.1 sulfite transporter TauE/SafE [Acinetobacter larvae]
MELYVLMFIAGIISGILTLLFGFGGGFVIVPLVYASIRYAMPPDSLAYDLAFKSAVATSLLLMVVNASLATYKQLQQANVLSQYIFPLAYWIALGAVSGTLLALYIDANLLKWFFAIYLLITIAECLYRNRQEQKRRQQNRRECNSVADDRQQTTQVPYTTAARALTGVEKTICGWLIGNIAAALGVGGSVMTVPLFRRCHLSMQHAVALANPLSIPVAVAGCVSYIVAYVWQPQALGSYFIGYFYLPAVFCLIVAGLIGIRIASPLLGRLSNRWHEWGYIVLLSSVLLLVIAV